MPRIRKRKLLLFIVIALGIVAYCLVLIGSELISESSDFYDRLDSMTARPSISRFSSNIQHPEIKPPSLHASHSKQSDPQTKRLINTWQLKHELPPRNVNELGRQLVANEVFYFWCGDKTFEFKHYLSVRSVWKYLEPDILEIHYKHEPIQDKYNNWLDMLKSSIPNLALKKMPNWTVCDSCDNYIRDILNDRGGVYVSEDTVLLNSLHSFKNTTMTVFRGNDNSPKLILSAPHLAKLEPVSCYSEIYKKFASIGDGKDRRCHEYSTDSSNTTQDGMECTFLSQYLIPKDIFTANDSMTAALREIAYGEREKIMPYTDGNAIPKVVHYIWYNRADMTFVMYLSILSSLFVINADKIFIHGGNFLEGHYWEKVKVNPRVQSVDRGMTRNIFGNTVLYTHHKSDVIRADVLYKYGGIYVDWDVLWLKPIDELISAGNDVIVNLDHMSRYPFPNSINMGVVLSKPRARYIDLWRKTYINYRSNDFFYNPIEVPYKIYEMYPSLVRIEPRLQVMCFRLKCHPTFHPDFKNFMESQYFDWRRDAYAIHFTHPDPIEYKNETALENGRGMFAEIGKYIINAAHL